MILWTCRITFSRAATLTGPGFTDANDAEYQHVMKVPQGACGRRITSRVKRKCWHWARDSVSLYRSRRIRRAFRPGSRGLNLRHPACEIVTGSKRFTRLTNLEGSMGLGMNARKIPWEPRASSSLSTKAENAMIGMSSRPGNSCSVWANV